MRRTVVRLIAKREVRDLLRDRRTLMIVLGLPAVLYPAFVVVGLAFAMSLMDQRTVIGVVGMEHTPAPKGHPEALLAGAALSVEADRRWDDPALFIDGHFNPAFVKGDATAGSLIVRPLDGPDRGPLDAREVDAILVIPPGVMSGVERGQKPELRMLGRDGDETSKLAVGRVGTIVGRWRDRLKEGRFARRGLPADLHAPV